MGCGGCRKRKVPERLLAKRVKDEESTPSLPKETTPEIQRSIPEKIEKPPEIKKPKKKIKKELPPLISRIFNFRDAVVFWMKEGQPTRNKEEIHRIFQICEDCEEFDGKHCTMCGCFVRDEEYHPLKLNKLVMETEICPLSKWE